MRVVIDARWLDDTGSGIGSYTLNLIKAILDQEDRIELQLVVRSGADAKQIEHPRASTVLFSAPCLSVRTRLLLGRYLNSKNYDLFHTFFPVLPCGITKPTVVTVHDLMWLINPALMSKKFLHLLMSGTFYKSSIRYSLTWADRVLAVSECTRRDIIAVMPGCASKTRVTYNGVEGSTVFPLPGPEAAAMITHIIEPGVPFILTVGTNSPYKNHLNAVRGFLEAFVDRPDYKMILVCRSVWQDREIYRLLSEPQVARRVIALRKVAPEVLNALFNSARIYLHPSLYEGFGIPLIEAMTVGTPVVTSNVSCLPEIVGEAAMLADPHDYKAIAHALRQVDGDEALRADLIKKGRERAARFTWKACAQATLKVYRELCSAG
jgi:glycosyltransferase involved in cell wall biosynthesis